MTTDKKPPPVPPRGHELFREFLLRNTIKVREAARALKVTHVAVIAWRDGQSIPERPSRSAISTYTSGEVPEDSWLTEKETERLAEVADVEPFHPEASAEPAPTFQVDDKSANGGSHAA